MHIQKIKIVDNGMKGLVLTHLVSEEKDGYPFMTPTKSEPKYPIHLGLEKKFKELRVHLLNVCDVSQRNEDELAFAINDTDILEIEVGEGFKLKGSRKVGDKSMILKTYLVEQEDYGDFTTVKKIINEILEEIREYVAGNKKISTEELGQRWIENQIRKGKGKEQDLVEFQGMSEESKKEFCKDFLVANGAIEIVMVEDLELPEGTKVLEMKTG